MIAGDENNVAKVFVGGLAPATTSDGLKAFFSQYGAVAEATIMMTTDKGTGAQRSRGFGFVRFETSAVVDTIIGPGVFSSRLLVEGADCEVKRIDENRGSFSEVEQRKIFVGGLPEECDTDKLRAYFEAIDPNIQDARVMIDPATQRSRRFGYVTFSSKEFVDHAVAKRESHYIGTKWIDVKPSINSEGKGKDGKKGKGKKGKDDGYYGKGYGHHAYDPYSGKGGYHAAYQQPAYAYPPAAAYPPAQPAAPQPVYAYAQPVAQPAATYAYQQPAAAPAAATYAVAPTAVYPGYATQPATQHAGVPQYATAAHYVQQPGVAAQPGAVYYATDPYGAAQATTYATRPAPY